MDHIRQHLKVYFIMGSVNTERDPRDVLEEAIKGGITVFQFREKGKGALVGAEKYRLALDLQAICKAHHIPFIVNDDVDLAIELDADGVHVGQEDDNARIVRERIGKHKWLGVSAYTIDECREAIANGADYLGCGPVYPTSTKGDAKKPQGTSLIREIRRLGLDIPIVGIGGINSANAGEVIRAGADGVSVISAISHAESAVKAAKNLRVAVENAKNRT